VGFALQIFEKLISGMYLGDIVRRVLLKIASQSTLLGDDINRTKLKARFILRTPDISALRHDETPGLSVVAEKLAENLQVRTRASIIIPP
jgi:hexokinase